VLNRAKMGYISSQGLANLGNYAYSGVDHSLLVKFVLKHYWNYLVEFLPVWLAPNVITLIGLIHIWISFATILYYCDSLSCSSALPSWVYLFISYNIFAYQTADNLDGKQARRTKSSSPLGEVFDHAGDCITIPMFGIIISTALELTALESFALLICVAIMFYLCHFEAYFTGTIILGPIVNPTEAQLGLIGILLVTYSKGSLFWKETQINVNQVPFFSQFANKNGMISLNTFIIVTGCVFVAIAIYKHIQTVRKFLITRGLKQRNSLLFLSPMAFAIVVSSLWVLVSNPDSNVLMEHPRLFLFANGFLYAFITIRQIVHKVCGEQFKLYYNIQTSLFFCFLISLMGRIFSPILTDSFLLQIYTFIVSCNLGLLVVSLIQEFCVHLNIRPFSIS